MSDQPSAEYVSTDAMTTDEKVDLILEKIVATEAMVAKIIEEVKPTIDELMNSSLFKMLGMKAKK